MDTALRNRLTGAVLLIFLAVALLPELLSGAGDRARDAAEPAVDGAESVYKTYNFALDDTAARSPVAGAEAPVPNPVPNPAPNPAPQPSPEPTPTPAPVTEASPPVATKPTPTPAPTSAPKPAPSVTPASAAPTPSAVFFVQLGVFSNKPSADQLARAVRAKGYKVTVTRVDGPTVLHRVRVGPVADRPAATELSKRLAAAGHAGTIVAPPGGDSR